ncbi:MAG TPA: hypothetical protein VJC13_03635 [Candidatus Paceibacterota bacterium]
MSTDALSADSDLKMLFDGSSRPERAGRSTLIGDPAPWVTAVV